MTSIEWTEATWNPIAGCTVHSPGCTNCYAMRTAARLASIPATAPVYAGLTQPSKAGPVWTGKIAVNESTMLAPLRRKKPTMYFVNSMSDLFHESVSDEVIDRVFAVMALCPQHTFQVLTKRGARMREYMSKVWGDLDEQFARTTAAVNYVFRAAGHRGNWGYCGATSTAITTIIRPHGAREYGMLRRLPDGGVERFYWSGGEETWFRCSDEYAARVPVWGAHRSEFAWGLKMWPLPNVWLGVSVEDQKRADERIPDLLATPAAVRFLSCEPLLGPVSLEEAWHGETALNSECWGECGWCVKGYPPLHNCQNHRQSEADWAKGRSGLDWVIVGGESGPGARPMHSDWARSLRDQCAMADVPFFFKQWGNYLPAGQIATQTGLWSPTCGSPLCTTKKNAGRSLDGVTHDAMPQVQV